MNGFHKIGFLGGFSMRGEKNPNAVAIIPARGGSKGIPNKNIALLAGKPLVVHAIEVALASKHIDRVIVSTDSPLIAEVAKEAGAEIPCLRPKELASDESHLADVTYHMISFIESRDKISVETVVVLLPTNPLRTLKQINEAIEKFWEVKADTLCSISIAPSHPQDCLTKKDNEDQVGFYLPDELVDQNGLRQKKPQVYVANGAICIAKKMLISKASEQKVRHVNGARLYGYEIDNFSALDINTPFDLFLAEQIVKYRSQT